MPVIRLSTIKNARLEPGRWRKSAWVAVIGVSCFLTEPALRGAASETQKTTSEKTKKASPDVQSETKSLGQVSPDAIDSQIRENRELQQSWVDRLPDRLGMKYYRQAQDWMFENAGLQLSLAYTSLGVVATDSRTSNDSAASGDLDFIGSWAAWGKKTGNTGTIEFNLRERHRYTAESPAQLSADVGSLWNIAGGYNAVGLQLTQFYLDQYFLDKNVGIRIGQVYQDLVFDSFAYKSSKLFFINSAFSDNPAVAFPDFGVGFATLVRPTTDWYFLTGAGDAQGRKLDAGLDQLLSSEQAFASVELGWVPSSGVMRNHHLSLFTWYSPAKQSSRTPDGEGVTFTYEWLPEKDYGLFARYSYSGSTATKVKHLGSTGVVWRNPFERDFDRLGLAFAWGTPSEDLFTPPPGQGSGSFRLRDQGVMELFYRFQISPLFQITPDIQVIMQPSLNPSEEVVAIFGLRGRISL